MSRVARRRLSFDPRPHERELSAVIEAVAASHGLDARGLDRIVKRHPRAGSGLFGKSEILAGYRALGGEGRFGIVEAEFARRLRRRPVRTLSGVTPVTVLTKPYPCPGRCVFCPNDVRMPKSYLAAEPGAQRAEDNRFDPYLQTWNRLAAYRAIGHPTEKVELNVLGGTWSFYPESYQRWFVLRCLEALNDFGAEADGRGAAGVVPLPEEPAELRGAVAGAYNRVVGDAWLHASESAEWGALERAQLANEGAGARCVGLAVETRPDRVDAGELFRLRRLGVTKVQIGIQSLSDAVLDANQRGHAVAQSFSALAGLRGAGFKIHAHFMPNLLGSTPADDLAGWTSLFEDPRLCPDEVKLYPCVLIPSAELVAHHARGEWAPYDDATLAQLVAACLERVPEWCRVTRVIRDFSAADIAAGSHTANLREVAEAQLRESGGALREIRSREIRDAAFDPEQLELREHRYATSTGEERFLEFATPEGRLAGFLRLSLPTRPAPLDELQGSAIIREIHVYGSSLELGASPEPSLERDAQHRGLGTRLLEAAARIARDAGYTDLAVISAIGTRPWYRTRLFHDAPLYQHLSLT